MIRLQQKHCVSHTWLKFAERVERGPVRSVAGLAVAFEKCTRCGMSRAHTAFPFIGTPRTRAVCNECHSSASKWRGGVVRKPHASPSMSNSPSVSSSPPATPRDSSRFCGAIAMDSNPPNEHSALLRSSADRILEKQASHELCTGINSEPVDVVTRQVASFERVCATATPLLQQDSCEGDSHVHGNSRLAVMVERGVAGVATRGSGNLSSGWRTEAQ